MIAIQIASPRLMTTGAGLWNGVNPGGEAGPGGAEYLEREEPVLCSNAPYDRGGCPEFNLEDCVHVQ